MTTAYDDYVSPVFLTDDEDDTDAALPDDVDMEDDEEVGDGTSEDEMDDGEK
jgi:hypothetical protein